MAFPFRNARQQRRYPGDRDARSASIAPRHTSPAADEYLSTGHNASTTKSAESAVNGDSPGQDDGN